MEPIIVRLEDFYMMKKDEKNALDDERRSYVIPKYQREYAWNNDRISDLINDISIKDKFLGIIILDKVSDCFEIIDGQQRITTLYMILAAIYNAYSDSPMEQGSIKSIMQPFGKNVLINESIGDYLKIGDSGEFEITISDDPEKDIYCQKGTFLQAYKFIKDAVNDFEKSKGLREFKDKLLDCTLLLLINVNHGSTKRVEQIFLDINEKSELLCPADIFKGHCFKNYSYRSHDELKDLWVKLKRCSISFEKFGVKDLSQYIYNFLLITDNNSITEKLRLNRKHYLDTYNTDDIKNLLGQMISYGNAIIKLKDNIDKNGYNFEDLCPDAKKYKGTNYHKLLKIMFIDILSLDANYGKLPAMYFVFKLSSDKSMIQSITYDIFKRIVTNLYVYEVLFSLSSSKKSKKQIDYSIRDALNSETNALGVALKSSKELRANMVKDFQMPNSCSNYNTLSRIYSIMDCYRPAENWLSNKYSIEEGINLEHFVMPDNSDYKIDWIIEEHGERQSIQIPVRVELAKRYKKYTTNYILLDKDLNRSLHSYDIIEKIKLIKQWFHVVTDYSYLPKHVKIFFEYIEKMSLYKELFEMKEKKETDENVFRYKYYDFLADYFSEQRQNELLGLLKNEFKHSFENH